MNQRDYWEQRMLRLESQTYRKGQGHARDVSHAFAIAGYRIKGEIEKWIYRITQDDIVSFAEMQRRLRERELENYRWAVAEYIDYAKENGLSRQWLKKLENASVGIGVTRWEAFQISLMHHLVVAYSKELAIMQDLLVDVAMDRYNASAYEVMDGIDHYSKLTAYASATLLKVPWTSDGNTFSDRIQLGYEQTTDDLLSDLRACLIRGGLPDEVIRQTRLEVSRTMEAAASRAVRLTMTESSAIATRAQADAFRDLDVEEVEIIATLDGKTCGLCGSKDLKRISIGHARIGYELPPFHPNCRCTFAPYVEGYASTERMARDPDSGKSEYVPHMSYEEWSRRYLQPQQDGVHSNSIGGVISRKTSDGKPAAILHVGGNLNHRQQKLLEALAKTDDRVTVRKKDVSMKDLAALTAFTGDEFAMFTKGGERLIMRGDTTRVNLGVEDADRLAALGYRFSGHTHPTVDPLDLFSSKGDRAVLRAFGMRTSVIYNPAGQYRTFEAD